MITIQKLVLCAIALFSFNSFSQVGDTCITAYDPARVTSFGNDEKELILNQNGFFWYKSPTLLEPIEGVYHQQGDSLILEPSSRRMIQYCITTKETGDSAQFIWTAMLHSKSRVNEFLYAKDSFEVIINDEVFLCAAGTYSVPYYGVIRSVEIPFLNTGRIVLDEAAEQTTLVLHLDYISIAKGDFEPIVYLQKGDVLKRVTRGPAVYHFATKIRRKE